MQGPLYVLVVRLYRRSDGWLGSHVGIVGVLFPSLCVFYSLVPCMARRCGNFVVTHSNPDLLFCRSVIPPMVGGFRYTMETVGLVLSTVVSSVVVYFPSVVLTGVSAQYTGRTEQSTQLQRSARLLDSSSSPHLSASPVTRGCYADGIIAYREVLPLITSRVEAMRYHLVLHHLPPSLDW